MLTFEKRDEAISYKERCESYLDGILQMECIDKDNVDHLSSSEGGLESHYKAIDVIESDIKHYLLELSAQMII